MGHARSESNILEAKSLYSLGLSRREIGLKFGVGESTIRQWMMTPEEYAEYKRSAVQWQRDNKDVVNERQRIKSQNRTRAEKDKANKYARHRYATNPRMKAKMRELMAKHRNTAQGKMRNTVRIAALSYADRLTQSYFWFMDHVAGISQREFAERFAYVEGTEFDHIVPVCAFDLTNPEHLVRCCYYKNLQLLPKKQNQYKARSGRNVDVMQLPWSGTPQALAVATRLITKRLATLDREPNRGPIPMVGCEAKESNLATEAYEASPDIGLPLAAQLNHQVLEPSSSA